MNQVKIYILIDPINNLPRYIGKTKRSLKRRLYFHLRDTTKNHRTNWLNILKSQNILPLIEVLDEVPELEWEFWEQYWICQFKAWGFDLVNKTIGGIGLHNIGDYVKKGVGSRGPLSESHKNNISKANKEFYKHNKRIISEEQKKKMRLVNLGRKLSEEHRRKISESNKGKKKTKTRARAIVQYTLDNSFISEYSSSLEASIKTGIPRGSISGNLTNRLTHAGGFIWKYKTENYGTESLSLSATA